MTDRKPAGLTWRSWIDHQIDDSRARGEFDNLPGAGKPFEDLDKPYDEMWWVKQFMAREGADFLPETLRLRRDVEKAREALPELASEFAVRRQIKNLNAHIDEVNKRAYGQIPSNVKPLDPEEAVSEWRRVRPERPKYTRAPDAPPWPLITAILAAMILVPVLLLWLI